MEEFISEIIRAEEQAEQVRDLARREARDMTTEANRKIELLRADAKQFALSERAKIMKNAMATADEEYIDAIEKGKIEADTQSAEAKKKIGRVATGIVGRVVHGNR